MRKIATLVAALSFSMAAAPAEAAPDRGAVDSVCASVRDHNQKAQKVFRVKLGGEGGSFHGHQPTEQQLYDLALMRNCMEEQNRAKYKLMRGAYRKLSARNRWYRYIDSITPYGPHDEWAIPFYIVHCESSSEGYWPADNPSGAIGPYQLLGKGAMWPANTPTAMADHHVKAYNLYDGGNGASHWVCA